MATVEAYETTAGRRYMVRYRTPERKQTKKRGFKTKRSAEAFASSLEVSILRGEFIDPTAARSTVHELGGAWLGRQTHLKPSTARAIESSWRLHVTPRWGSVPVAEIRRTAVQAWVSDLSATYSATTVARAHGALASLLDDAVDDRRILTNPARGVNLPRKVRREHTYLDHQQVAALAAAAGRHESLVLVLAYCGLRWGEAAGLRVRDLDMLRQRLRINQNAVEVGSEIVVGTPKTHERRSVPFPAFLSMPLAAACEGKGRDDVVFHGDRDAVEILLEEVRVDVEGHARGGMSQHALDGFDVRPRGHREARGAVAEVVRSEVVVDARVTGCAGEPAGA